MKREKLKITISNSLIAHNLTSKIRRKEEK